MSLLAGILSLIVFIGFTSNILYELNEQKPLKIKDILYALGMLIISIITFIDYFQKK